MFSNGSSSSMSRAIVTPSLVIVGEPNFLSRTTFRPFGPDRHLDRVGEAVDAALEGAPGGVLEDDLLSHGFGFLLGVSGAMEAGVWRRAGCPAARPGQASTIARMSFWLTIRRSSPSTLNSVPAYLA